MVKKNKSTKPVSKIEIIPTVERETKTGLKFKTVRIVSKYENNMINLNDIKNFYKKIEEKYEPEKISILSQHITKTTTMKGFNNVPLWDDKNDDYFAGAVDDTKFDSYYWVDFIVKE